MTISRGNTITDGRAMFCTGESRGSVGGTATDLLTCIGSVSSLCRPDSSDQLSGLLRCGSFVAQCQSQKEHQLEHRFRAHLSYLKAANCLCHNSSFLVLLIQSRKPIMDGGFLSGFSLSVHLRKTVIVMFSESIAYQRNLSETVLCVRESNLRLNKCVSTIVKEQTSGYEAIQSSVLCVPSCLHREE